MGKRNGTREGHEWYPNMFYGGKNDRNLNIYTGDSALAREVRAYLYAQNFVDVMRSDVEQKTDREIGKSLGLFLRDNLADPDSDYYRYYYKGNNSPEECVKFGRRVNDLSRTREPNRFVKKSEVMDYALPDEDEKLVNDSAKEAGFLSA